MSILDELNERYKKVPRSLKSKTARLENFNQIKDKALALIQSSVETGVLIFPAEFYSKEVVPLLTETEKTFYNEQTFTIWFSHLKLKLKAAKQETKELRKDLVEAERLRRIGQIEIRQEATGLMGDFLSAIRRVAANLDEHTPAELKKMNINPLQIYRIIREEEDRQEALRLKARSEDRADAQFALALSMAKANQLSEEDIQFLSEDIKRELLMFKQSNGIYQLPKSNPVAEIYPASENASAGTTSSATEGAA